MKFAKKTEDVLNEQVMKEIWSAHLYLSMSSWFESQGLRGFANWMRVQYQEEMTHAIKIFDYIISRGGRALVKPIDVVPSEWKGIKQIFEDTYNHECVVTESIHNCYNVAAESKDYAATNMLQWFVDEQVEEEQNVIEILDQLKLIGDNGQAIYLLDKELATRVFVDSTKPSAN
jgi:ferritin